MSILGATSRRRGQGDTRRRLVQGGILLAAVLLVAVLAYRQIYRWSATPLWIAAGELAPGTEIGEQDLKLVYQRGDLPQGVLLDRSAIVGKTLYRPKTASHPFFAADLTPPPKPKVEPPSLTTAIPEDRVLAALEVEKMNVPYKNLRRGDRLEILAVGRGTPDGPAARVVAHDAFMIGTIAPSAPPPPPASQSRLGQSLDPPKQQQKGSGQGLTLILGLHPGDALTLAEAQGTGATISVVLHGAREVERGELLRLEPEGPKEVELIAGLSRETVTFPR